MKRDKVLKIVTVFFLIYGMIGIQNLWAESPEYYNKRYGSDALSQSVELLLEDVFVSKPSPEPGDLITINATVKNVGKVAATNIPVILSLVTPGHDIVLGEQSVNIPDEGSQDISFEWRFTPEFGMKNIEIIIDPAGAVSEVSKDNNRRILPIEEKIADDEKSDLKANNPNSHSGRTNYTISAQTACSSPVIANGWEISYADDPMYGIKITRVYRNSRTVIYEMFVPWVMINGVERSLGSLAPQGVTCEYYTGGEITIKQTHTLRYRNSGVDGTLRQEFFFRNDGSIDPWIYYETSQSATWVIPWKIDFDVNGWNYDTMYYYPGGSSRKISTETSIPSSSLGTTTLTCGSTSETIDGKIISGGTSAYVNMRRWVSDYPDYYALYRRLGEDTYPDNYLTGDNVDSTDIVYWYKATRSSATSGYPGGFFTACGF